MNAHFNLLLLLILLLLMYCSLCLNNFVNNCVFLFVHANRINRVYVNSDIRCYRKVRFVAQTVAPKQHKATHRGSRPILVEMPDEIRSNANQVYFDTTSLKKMNQGCLQGNC